MVKDKPAAGGKGGEKKEAKAGGKGKGGEKKEEKGKGGKEEKGKGGKEEKGKKEEKGDKKAGGDEKKGDEKKGDEAAAAVAMEEEPKERQKKAKRRDVVPTIQLKEKKLAASDKGKSASMRRIRIEKLVINICVGESGDKLTKAARVLHDLTEQEPVMSVARLTVRTFGIRRNEKIACHVTVRGKKAEEILRKGLDVHEYMLKDGAFSQTGNFGFGIQEHIDLGLKYDPAVGIYGMDFFVVLARPGFRVAHKKRGQSRVGVTQRISKEQAQKWFVSTLQGEIRPE